MTETPVPPPPAVKPAAPGCFASGLLFGVGFLCGFAACALIAAVAMNGQSKSHAWVGLAVMALVLAIVGSMAFRRPSSGLSQWFLIGSFVALLLGSGCFGLILLG